MALVVLVEEDKAVVQHLLELMVLVVEAAQVAVALEPLVVLV
jgi:hypothetical protein